MYSRFKFNPRERIDSIAGPRREAYYDRRGSRVEAPLTVLNVRETDIRRH